MKWIYSLFFLGTLTLSSNFLSGQIDTSYSDTSLYYIGTIDGGQFMGKILNKNDREFYIETTDKGKMYIPKYVISEIKIVQNKQNGSAAQNAMSQHLIYPPNPHPSRYYYSPSALPIEKGEGYINCTYFLLYQAQYGLTDNISIGGTMTIVGMPAMFNVKWSQKISEKFHIGAGGQIGKTWWTSNSDAIGVGFLNATLGQEESNITVNGGYGFYGSEHINLISVAATQRISKKLSLLFEAWSIFQPNYDPIYFGGPGFRLYAGKKATWDFGFIALSFQEEYWGMDQFGMPKLYKKGHDYFPIPFIAATYKL